MGLIAYHTVVTTAALLYFVFTCISNLDDDEYCRIVHVSITVLVIYTFGTSLLLWWLYKKLANCCCDHVKGTHTHYTFYECN